MNLRGAQDAIVSGDFTLQRIKTILNIYIGQEFLTEFPFAINRGCGHHAAYTMSELNMKNWTTKEAAIVIEWARRPAETRPPLDVLTDSLGRSAEAIRSFLRRTLPSGQRPWEEKPRWTPEEFAAVLNSESETTKRSAAAIRKYARRHGKLSSTAESDQDAERASLTVRQIASDLGLSRATIYRFIKMGILRRFKGRVAETSFLDLLRNHPEAIPYSRLPREQREWLVLNGYSDPTLLVKPPSTKGLLD